MNISMQLTILSVLVFLAVVGLSDAIRNYTIRPRIVGGQVARAGQFPFIVSVRRNTNVCGGSIMSARYVVTAGHCVHGGNGRGPRFQASEMRVRAGTNRLSSGGVIYRVAEIKVHPQYATLRFDIALLRMAELIRMTNLVRPIPLSNARVGVGVQVVAIGWGNTQTGGSVSQDLRYVTLTSVSDQECARHHPFHDSVFCLGHPVGRGICQGDSGGPAVLNGMLVGATSFSSGTGCGTAIPDGFARISYLWSWLQANSR